MHRPSWIIATIVAVVCLTGWVSAQDMRVDLRIDRSVGRPGVQQGTGRVLDASFRRGSGGINTTIPRGYTGKTGLDSITEARGLSAFRGRAPSLANQLGVRDSTGGVSRFIQQSVGTSDVVGGANALYRPWTEQYIDPLVGTVRKSDVLEANRLGRPVRPGLNTVTQSTAMAKKLYLDATVDYRSMGQHMAENVNMGNLLGVQLTSAERSAGLRASDLTSASSLRARQVEMYSLTSRGGEELFGMISLRDRQALAQEIYELSQDPTDDKGPLDATVREEKTDTMGRPVDAAITGDALAERLSTPGRTPTLPRDTTTIARVPIPGEPVRDEKLPDPNQDVLLDLLVTLRDRKTIENLAEQGQLNEEQIEQFRARASAAEGSKMNVILDEDMSIRMRSLSGKSGDTFNRYMTKGQKALLDGRYYLASRMYELATLARPRNPLGRLGVALANFGASEWYTAGAELQRAIQLFPPLMEVKVDLGGMMSRQELTLRIDELDRWIQSVNDKPVLLLLAAFVHRCNGNDAAAKRYAERLVKEEGVRDDLRRYGTYILTGKRPTSKKGSSRKRPTPSPKNGLKPPKLAPKPAAKTPAAKTPNRPNKK